MRSTRTGWARRVVEERYGPLRSALLSRLQQGMTFQEIGLEWGVHFNTIQHWAREEGIERRVTYEVREAVGAPE